MAKKSNGETSSATGKRRSRKKSESDLQNQIQISQMQQIFNDAEMKKEASSVIMPMRVQNSLSSSNMVTEVFKKIKFEGGPSATRTPPPKTKIVLDTEKVLLATGDQFTEFDRAVLEAVFAQLTAGNTIMTPAMIFRSMTSKESGVNVSTDMLDEINKSINKCMYGKVTIPFFDERKNKEIVFDSTILNIIRAEYNVAGHETQAYEVQSEPMLYSYCHRIGALICSPIEMNAIPMSMTKRSVAIMNFLQRIVAPHLYTMDGQCIVSEAGYGAKEGEKIPGAEWIPADYIEYKTLFETVMSLDNSTCTRWLMNKTRETVKTILDHWTKHNYIRSWENIRGNNNSIAGLKIYYHPIRTEYALPQAPVLNELGEGQH